MKKSELTEIITFLTKKNNDKITISEKSLIARANIQRMQNDTYLLTTSALPTKFKNANFTGVLWHSQEYKITQPLKPLKPNFLEIIIKK